MPAVLEDPAAPVIIRQSGDNLPRSPHPSLPNDVVPRQVTLRDRTTVATVFPIANHAQLPMSLLSYLCDQLNREIRNGDTYPMMDELSLEGFIAYWFSNFGAIMLLGDSENLLQVEAGYDHWKKECLGSFYIKPNYPGRSSHVCNGGFLVTDGSRNRGVGKLMGESYIDWAPKLVSASGWHQIFLLSLF